MCISKQTAGIFNESGYHAPLFLDLKHYAVEQWGLKDPPQCDPFWLLKRNVLSGRCSACLYTRESLSMLIGQPTNQRSRTQLPERITHCLLLNESKWCCRSPRIWQGGLTCNFISTCATLVRGKVFNSLIAGYGERNILPAHPLVR